MTLWLRYSFERVNLAFSRRLGSFVQLAVFIMVTFLKSTFSAVLWEKTMKKNLLRYELVFPDFFLAEPKLWNICIYFSQHLWINLVWSLNVFQLVILCLFNKGSWEDFLWNVTSPDPFGNWIWSLFSENWTWRLQYMCLTS